jgi:ribonuclease Z
VKVGTGEDQHEVQPGQVMGDLRPGRKIVYTGDTRPIHTSIKDIARDADLLIHDATYDDTEADRGLEFYHATASQAGMAASALNARTLVLVHTSSRYTDAQVHISEAKKKFSGSIIAPDDLDIVEVAFRDRV